MDRVTTITGIVAVATLCTIAMIQFGTDSALLGVGCAAITALVLRRYRHEQDAQPDEL